MGAELLFSLLIGWYLMKGITQDVTWAVRGKDPPSYRRQQERAKARADMVDAARKTRQHKTGKNGKGGKTRGPRYTDRTEARRYWVNLWEDAWESANERREKGRARRADKSRAAGKAGDSADPDPARAGEPTPETGEEDDTDPVGRWVAAPPPPPPVPGDTPAGGSNGTGASDPQDAPIEDASRLGLGQEQARCTAPGCGQPITRVQRTRRGRVYCPDCYAGLPRCVDCGYRTEHNDLDPTGPLCPPCMGARRRDMSQHTTDTKEKAVSGSQQCGQCGQRPAVSHDSSSGKELCGPCLEISAELDQISRERALQHKDRLPGTGAGRAASVTPLRNNNTSNTGSSSTTSQGGSSVTTAATPTGETIGLDSAINYAAAMRTNCEQGANSCEQAVSHMTAGEVSGQAIDELRRAQEQLQTTANAFATAEATLAQHRQVQEQYRANPDAGNKQFLMQE